MDESISMHWSLEHAPLRELIGRILRDDRLLHLCCTAEQLLAPLNHLGGAGRDDIRPVDLGLIKRAFRGCGQQFCTSFRAFGIEDGGENVIRVRVGQQIDSARTKSRKAVCDFYVYENETQLQLRKEESASEILHHPLDWWAQFKRKLCISDEVKREFKAFLQTKRACSGKRKKLEQSRIDRKRRGKELKKHKRQHVDERRMSIPHAPSQPCRSSPASSKVSIEPGALSRNELSKQLSGLSLKADISRNDTRRNFSATKKQQDPPTSIFCARKSNNGNGSAHASRDGERGDSSLTRKRRDPPSSSTSVPITGANERRRLTPATFSSTPRARLRGMDPSPRNSAQVARRRTSTSDVPSGPDVELLSFARSRRRGNQDAIRRPGLGRVGAAPVFCYRIGDARARPAHSVRFASEAQASTLLAELPLNSPLFVKRTKWRSFTYAVLVGRTEGGDGGARLVVAMDHDGMRTKMLERRHWKTCLRLVNAHAFDLEESTNKRSKETNEGVDESITALRSTGHQSPYMETDITDMRVKLQTAIERTNSQTSVFKGEMNELTAERLSLGTETSCPATLKKRKELDTEIQIKKDLIKQYTRTLKMHMEELKKVNGESDGSSDDSSEEDSPVGAQAWAQ